jgi:Domain of unknown function (DUF4292)
MRPFLIILTFVLSFSSCKTTPAQTDIPTPPISGGLAQRKYPNHTLADMQSAVQAARPQLPKFQLSTKMNIVTPEVRQDVSSRIDYDVNQGVYANFTATILEIEGARMLIARDSFYLYNKLEGELIYGAVDKASQFLPISGTIPEVHDLLLGGLMPNFNRTWTVTPVAATDARPALYALVSENGRLRYEIDPTLWRVVRFEQKDTEGSVTELITYSNFKTFSGTVLPERIIVRQPKTNRNAIINVKELQKSPQNQRFDIRVNRSEVKEILVN